MRQVAEKIIPIEVKTTTDLASIDTGHLQRFLQDHKAPCAVVFYGGVPMWMKSATHCLLALLVGLMTPALSSEYTARGLV